MFVSAIGPAINQESQSVMRPSMPQTGEAVGVRGARELDEAGSTKQVAETGKTAGAASTSFSDLLREVVARDNFAQHGVEQYATGASQNIHETMIALEKADVTLSLLVNVRNKLMEAYKEVMRMS